MTSCSQIKKCKTCIHRIFIPATGLNCGLTKAKPVGVCNNYIIDERVKQKELSRKKIREEGYGREMIRFRNNNFVANYGIFGGVTLMLISIVWFAGGLAIGKLFYYAPVLFIFGIVAIIKGNIKEKSQN